MPRPPLSLGNLSTGREIFTAEPLHKKRKSNRSKLVLVRLATGITQATYMETLEFLRVQNVSLEASVILISMSLAARYYAPLDSFDPGSKCIALDDGERRLGIGSFAELCKSRRELGDIPYGLALFDAELDDANNACRKRNMYGDHTLVRAGRRALQYVDSDQFRREGRYRDCARAPPP
ncbi:hypothetical protein HPB50_023720 [Hyalomma asiaticum]|uniref:Uncharacterized protein n=1 Tax=Hyalomma asiaticum TaxID=266040 RepID=A0ACB7SPF4_HYAAI|nr:hypothetical protein HPB50_023720 [Hyalomma asiaticum]